jgi:hypothetical protein
MKPTYLTIAEYARRNGVSRQLVYKMIERRDLPVVAITEEKVVLKILSTTPLPEMRRAGAPRKSGKINGL